MLSPKTVAMRGHWSATTSHRTLASVSGSSSSGENPAAATEASKGPSRSPDPRASFGGHAQPELQPQEVQHGPSQQERRHHPELPDPAVPDGEREPQRGPGSTTVRSSGLPAAAARLEGTAASPREHLEAPGGQHPARPGQEPPRDGARQQPHDVPEPGPPERHHHRPRRRRRQQDRGLDRRELRVLLDPLGRVDGRGDERKDRGGAVLDLRDRRERRPQRHAQGPDHPREQHEARPGRQGALGGVGAP